MLASYFMRFIYASTLNLLWNMCTPVTSAMSMDLNFLCILFFPKSKKFLFYFLLMVNAHTVTFYSIVYNIGLYILVLLLYIFVSSSRKFDPMRMNKCGKVSPTSAIDSGYESTSTTTTIRRGHSSSSDLNNSRLSLVPPSCASVSSRGSGSPKLTPIDSLPLCLEQISAMNLITLQVCQQRKLSFDKTKKIKFR